MGHCSVVARDAAHWKTKFSCLITRTTVQGLSERLGLLWRYLTVAFPPRHQLQQRRHDVLPVGQGHALWQGRAGSYRGWPSRTGEGAGSASGQIIHLRDPRRGGQPLRQPLDRHGGIHGGRPMGWRWYARCFRPLGVMATLPTLPRQVRDVGCSGGELSGRWVVSRHRAGRSAG